MSSRPRFSRDLRWGLLLLLVCIALLVAVRQWVLPLWDAPPAAEALPTPEERQAIADFERQRLADSLARVQQREAEWQARQMAKAERQARYEAQRAQWAAEKAERAALRVQREAFYDSLRRLRPEKAKIGTLFDANAADTTDLMRIPGIGSHYARAIITYRERLGGFVSPQQVAEVEHLPHGIERWFRTETHAPVRRLRLNRASFKELVRHPYLSYEQVKAIVTRRQKMGTLRSWDDLRNNPLFSERDFERLTPYVRFD